MTCIYIYLPLLVFFVSIHLWSSVRLSNYYSFLHFITTAIATSLFSLLHVSLMVNKIDCLLPLGYFNQWRLLSFDPPTLTYTYHHWLVFHSFTLKVNAFHAFKNNTLWKSISVVALHAIASSAVSSTTMNISVCFLPTLASTACPSHTFLLYPVDPFNLCTRSWMSSISPHYSWSTCGVFSALSPGIHWQKLLTTSFTLFIHTWVCSTSFSWGRYGVE